MNVPSLRQLYGNAVIAAHWAGQRRRPFLPREKVAEIRDTRVRDIVQYAARHVPFYRDWFRHEGVDPLTFTGADDLDRLPLLDRNVVRADPRRFMAETSASEGALSFATSGSTGAPLDVYHDHRSLLANIAFGERERRPVIDVCGGSFRPKELYIGYETSTFKKVMAFYDRSTSLPVRPRRRFVSLREPIENVATILNDERPDVLVGYGGWIDLFFKTISARAIDLRPPKIVMYMGEALPHGAREHIEQQFGIPVFSRYNAVEAFKIAFYCEARSGFHVHADLCHVRIVGPDGRTAPAGQQGEIVISNLVNRASVLLNYPMGDVASMSDTACPCGRTFPRLSELEGRTEDIIPLADGRFVHPRSVWQILKDRPEILQYRLVQHEPRRFELSLVTVDEPAFARALGHSQPALEQLLGGDVSIEARRGEIHHQDGRKFRAVESRCARTAGR